MADSLNVYQKINEVKKVVKTLSKDAETSGKGAYAYVSGGQILSIIKDKMEEIGLLFLPVATEHRSWDIYNYKNSYGDDKTDFIVNGKLIYDWINCDDPHDRQRVEFDFYGQQNDISKAFGSGLTYSERYLLLKSLGAPTDEDDPDKKSGDKPQNRNKPNTSAGEDKKPLASGKKTKWAQVHDLIKDSDITLDMLGEWLAKKKYPARVNDLTDEQFNVLISALKKQIGAANE